MAEGFPQRTKVETTTLRSGIAYGIAVLGAIPLRYGEPRFPALRRKYADDLEEGRLLAVGGGTVPDIFALASFPTIGRPATVVGNQGKLRSGVNLGRNSGSLVRVSGAYVEITCNANIYAESLDDLLLWITAVIEHPQVKGRSEFAEGGSVPITVDITPSFDLTDPIASSDSGTYLERRFNIAVNFRITTIAARIQTLPLFKATLLGVGIDGEAVDHDIEIPATDIDDWP